MQVSTGKENNKKKPFNNNGRRKGPKKKIEMTRYTKDFSSFEDGIDDICDKSEFLFDLLKSYATEGGTTPKNYVDFKHFIINLLFSLQYSSIISFSLSWKSPLHIAA